MRTAASAAIFLLLLTPRGARAAESFGAASFYVGDLHAHTGYSGDAGSSDLGTTCEVSCGAFAEVFDTAKANGLDFVALTDHVNGGSAMTYGQFTELNAAVVAAHDPDNGFVTLPAAEVWFTLRATGARLGHKTLLFFGDQETVSALTLSDMRPGGPGSAIDACEDIWAWMDRVSPAFGGALLLPHHPAVRMPMHNDWACHDPRYEPAVEVYSEHGNSLADDGYDTPGEGVYGAFTVHSALDPESYGLTFGFVGGTDSHDTRPGGVCEVDTEQPTHLYAGGLTVAVLDIGEAFDRAALHDAIRERRTYVTTGPLLPMEVRWSAFGEPLGGLGEALSAPVSFDLDAEVIVPADRADHVVSVELVGPDARWTLVDDGAGVWSGAVPAGDVPEWLYVAVQIDGDAWYAEEEECEDGGDAVEWLWGSPSPVVVFEDDADGDGASSWLDDCDDDDAAAYPGAPEVWYDGVDQDCAGGDDFDQDADGARIDGGDCDDTDATVRPGVAEIWYDGVDQDCDGRSDFDQDRDGQARAGDGGLDCDDTDPTIATGRPEIWYDGIDQDCAGDDDLDQDGDGYIVEGVGGGDDCDDTDPDVFPGAPEIDYDGIDQACDGGSEADADEDGFDAVERGGEDCDDRRPEVNPDAVETWYDGRDSDCDGLSDFDADGDGFDAERGGGRDCDDDDAEVFPGAAEIPYDDVDQDCDRGSDWDQDADGFDAMAGGGPDCDDADAAIFPGAAETWYDGVDQDCDPSTEYDADDDGVLFPFDCHDDDPRAWACEESDRPAFRGCSTAGASASLGALALAALAVRRRRR